MLVAAPPAPVRVGAKRAASPEPRLHVARAEDVALTAESRAFLLLVLWALLGHDEALWDPAVS